MDTTLDQPFVSVSLSAYNAGSYIQEAIQSIIVQSYKNFELFIIDDCSTDNTVETIRSFTDDRIKFIQHSINKGLAHSRQEVIDQANGKYLFWMDADDISHPDRLAQQVEALEADPHLVICGTNAMIISEKGETVGTTSQPLDDRTIKAALFFGFPFTSPTVAIRLQCLKDIDFRWTPEIRVSEDYILYSCLLANGKFSNLPNPLYYYRIHEQPNRITSFRNSEAIIHGRKIAWRKILNVFDLTANDAVLMVHDKICYYPDRLTREDILEIPEYVALLSRMLHSNKEKRVFDQQLFHNNISHIIYTTLLQPSLSLNKSLQYFIKHLRGLRYHEALKFVPNKIRRMIRPHVKYKIEHSVYPGQA